MSKAGQISFAVYVFFVLLHFLLAQSVDGPMIYNDEIGYMGKAKIGMEGYEAFSSLPYYPGYSILLIPIFRIFAEIEVVYKMIQLANAMLMSLLPLLAYRLLGYFAPELRPGVRWLGAIVFCCYPPFLLQSNLAHAESLYIPLFVLLTWQVCLLAGEPGKKRYWLSTAAIFAYLLFTHPRTFAVLPALLIVYLLLGVQQLQRYWPVYKKLAIYLAMVLFLVIIGSAISWVYITGAGYRVGLEQMMWPLWSWPDMFYFLVSLCGKWCYVMWATYGVALLGMGYAIVALYRFVTKKISFAEGVPILFVLLSFVFVLLLSACIFGTTRGDYIFYGRYTEGVLLPMLLLGMACLWYERLWNNMVYLLTLAATMVIVLALIYCFHAPILPNLPTVPTNILGITPFTYANTKLQFANLLQIFSGITVVLLVIARYNRYMALWAIALVFLYHTVESNYCVFYIHSKHAAWSRSLITPLQEYVKYQGSGTLVYEKHQGGDQQVHIYPLYVPKLKLQHSSGLSPVGDLLLSHTWKNPGYPGARCIGLENHLPQYLWLLPGPAQQHFIEIGHTLPEQFPCALPEEAYRASITTDCTGRYRWQKKIRIPLTIHHIGKQSLWPSFSGLKQAEYSVALKIEMRRRDDLAVVYTQLQNLPTSLYPGQQTQSLRKISLLHNNGNRLSDGDYLLRFDLHHVGVRPFSQNKDVGITMHLKIVYPDVYLAKRSGQ
jgi:hypothetical protein